MTDERPVAEGMPVTGWRRSLGSIEAAALAGLVAAIGWVYSLVRLTEGPGIDASEAEIASFFADPDTGWDILITLQVLVVATAGFLWFVGVIRNRAGDAAPRLFDTVFFGGGIIFACVMFIGCAALAAPFTLNEFGGVQIEPGAAAMIRSFALVILAVFAPRIAALFVLSSSTLGLRAGVLPRWLIFVGYLLGVGLILNVTFNTPNVYVFPGWIALVSIVLLFRRHPRDLPWRPTPN